MLPGTGGNIYQGYEETERQVIQTLSVRDRVLICSQRGLDSWEQVAQLRMEAFCRR